MMYGGPVIGPVAGPPRKIVPVRDPLGRPGTFKLSVPIFDPPGQLTSFLVWMPIWAGVQASRPRAADSLSVLPSGRVTLAVLSWYESSSSGPGLWGSVSSVVTPSGALSWVVSGASANPGAKGTTPQFSVPMGVVDVSTAVAPSAVFRVSIDVVWPGQLVGVGRKPPLPRRPLVP